MTDQEIALQRRAARLVEREVNCCLSSLVATLAGGALSVGSDAADLYSLAEQAFELAVPTLDYESAATEHGWTCTPEGWWWREPTDEEREDGSADFYFLGSGPFVRTESAQDACEMDDREPHEREVYEHWAVSTWLAEKLIAKGERVDTDFAGLNVWARTTTGQAISADSVIEAITAETGYASGGEIDATQRAVLHIAKEALLAGAADVLDNPNRKAGEYPRLMAAVEHVNRALGEEA